MPIVACLAKKTMPKLRLIGLKEWKVPSVLQAGGVSQISAGWFLKAVFQCSGEAVLLCVTQ